MDGVTLIGGAIISKAQSAFAEMLWSKVTDGVRARLTLSKVKIKKAMEVALIYALERTVQQHLYFDSDLFLGNLFERPDTALIDRLLSRENYPTAPELAEAWAKNLANTPDSERSRYAEAMIPQCDTFLQEFRRALIHTRLLQSDPAMADLLALDSGLMPIASPVPSTQAITPLEQQLAEWVENVTGAYQNLSATLSQWMQRRWSSGLHQLPTDYTSELKNFLYEYLGGPGRTVPFGGRQSDLDFLTGWLDDPYMPQRLLIAAEAGRGKSALLARWCAQLQLRGATHIIFIPISLRFGTAAPEIYFSMLAARLAVIRGETIQHAQLNAAQWKGVCNSYLAQLSDDERVLIVLDGLDESIDPHVIDKSLIPRSLPKRVKVVVSARTQTDKNEAEWLRTLGWEIGNLGRSTKLLPLSEKGVRDVLEAMGNPLDHLAERDAVIQALYRLTEGDPLLVGLYVDALAFRGGQVPYITLEELAQIKPGLEGYFDQWWEDQHKQWEAKGANPLTRPEVEDFFYTLATARGPITKAELQQVLSGTTAPRLTHMAQEVKRFVVGDGVGSGYAFSHPRLGYYFLDQLSDTDKVTKHLKYLGYGEKVVQALKSTPASTVAQKHSYILQHFIHHLLRTDASAEKYYALLCHEWAEAWFALRGTYDGFLVDIAHIWEQAREDTRQGNQVRGISKEILCALCQSSIVALSSNIDPNLLVLAVEAGIYTPTQAFTIIRQMAKDRQRVSAIQALTLLDTINNTFYQQLLELSRSIQSDFYRASALSTLAQRHKGEMRHTLLLEALEVARSIQDHSSRNSALRTIAPLLPIEQGLEVARSIQDDVFRTYALSKIAQQLEGEMHHTLLQEALEVTRSIRKSSARFAAISTITFLLPLDQGLELARSIEPDSFRADALSAIAQQHEGAIHLEVLQEALGAARSIQPDAFRAYALNAIAQQVKGELRQVLLREALEVAYPIKDEPFGAGALIGIAPFLPLDQGLEVARSLRKDVARASALTAIAQQLEGQMRHTLLQEALEVARSIRDDPSCANVLSTIAQQYEGEVRQTLLQEALEATQSIRDESSRTTALTTIAQQCNGGVRLTLLREALEVAHSIRDESSCDRAIRTIAFLLPINQGLEVARSIHKGVVHASTLGTISQQYEREMRDMLLQEALEVARSITFDYTRAYSLNTIAQQVKGELRQVLLQEALEVAHSIKDNSERDSALSAIAPLLPLDQALEVARSIQKDIARVDTLRSIAQQLEGDRRSTLLQEVLEATHSIRDNSERASALSAIAPLLPLDQALEVARSIQKNFARASALSTIAQHYEGDMPQTVLQETLETMRLIQDKSSRASALSTIAQQYEGDMRHTLLQEALETTRLIQEDPSRASALSTIAQQYEGDMRHTLLQEALETTRLIQEDHYRASALGTIATLSISLPLSSFLYPKLQEELHKTFQHSATFSRPAFLSDLTALLPLTFFLADHDTLSNSTEEALEPFIENSKPSTQLATEFAKAIRDVCSWWP